MSMQDPSSSTSSSASPSSLDASPKQPHPQQQRPPTSPISSLLSTYESFVVSNAPQIASLENLLRSFSYLLPGRFTDAELASEVLFSVVNLMDLFHSRIITTHHPKAHSHASLFNKYTIALVTQNALSNRSASASSGVSSKPAKLAYVLALINCIEIVVEMVVEKRYGKKTKWRIVLLLEGIKAACKIALLRSNGSRMLLHSSVPERLVAEELPNSSTSTSTLEQQQQQQPKREWTSARTGKLFPTTSKILGAPITGSNKSAVPAPPPQQPEDPLSKLLGMDSKPSPSSPATVTDYLMNKALKKAVKSPLDLVRQLKGVHLFAEYLFILRPLIYVLFINRYGLKSWKPFLTSLLIEGTSHYLGNINPHLITTVFRDILTHGTDALSIHDSTNNEEPKGRGAKYVQLFKLMLKTLLTTRSSTSSPPTILESEELGRRRYLFLWYLLRSPLYEAYTKGKLDSFVDSASKKPIISLLATILKDYMPLWERVYFVTSASS